MKVRIGCSTLVLLSLVLSSPIKVSGTDTGNSDSEHGFRLRSKTFENGATLPLSVIATFNSSSGQNICTVDGSPGGNQSPELSWTGAPHGTQSFVVIMYDITASFTHWGMYNISPKTQELPANAGVAGTTFGIQVANDYGIGDLSYDGPCPPKSVTPNVHHYVFTVYALNAASDAFVWRVPARRRSLVQRFDCRRTRWTHPGQREHLGLLLGCSPSWPSGIEQGSKKRGSLMCTVFVRRWFTLFEKRLSPPPRWVNTPCLGNVKYVPRVSNGGIVRSLYGIRLRLA